jgi:hypothetical protein
MSVDLHTVILTDPSIASAARPLMGEPRYSVFTWDHEAQGWHARDRRATKWRLRRWLRKLYRENWDRVSILIERND